MRAESSNETTRTQGSTRSESKSEKDSKGAQKAADEARKAAEDARKAAEDSRRAAAEASRASTAAARQQATRRAEESARQATALSQKANEAAQRAEQLARSAQQSARPGTADAQAAQLATKSAQAARGAAKASTQAASEATKTLQSLRTPGTGDGFTANSTAASTGSTSAPATAQAAPLPPAAQAAVAQAQQAQTAAQTAAATSLKADQRVREAQEQVLQAQQAATLARNDLDKGVQRFDPLGSGRRMLQEANDAAMAQLSAARQELSAAQAEASTASQQARAAATTANQAAQQVEQLARQNPQASVTLNAVAADTRRAATAASNGATIAAEAAKPKPIATVGYDMRFGTQNNGGQHDIIFDGAVVGGNGQVYPPGTDASQIAGVKPNNGTPATGERIYYVNGIQNTASFQSQSIQNIANATGAEVVGIHNSTEGMASDLDQCLLDKLPGFASTNAATRALAVQIVKDVEAGRPVHLMAHSQGGLVTSGALTLAKQYFETVKPGNAAQADALLKNIKVETFGSAAASWPYGPRYTHYINENDTVPMLAGLGRQGNPGRQQNAGGDRAEIHFIRNDPRSANPLLQTPESNLFEMIPAHDFNDGYLYHRQSWEQGQSNSADLSGPSPVASRNEDTNELEGYNYYHVDTSSPEAQEARARRDAVEEFWQDVNRGTQVVGAGLDQASQAVTAGLDTAGQALRDGATAVGSFLNPWD